LLIVHCFVSYWSFIENKTVFTFDEIRLILIFTPYKQWFMTIKPLFIDYEIITVSNIFSLLSSLSIFIGPSDTVAPSSEYLSFFTTFSLKLWHYEFNHLSGTAILGPHQYRSNVIINSFTYKIWNLIVSG